MPESFRSGSSRRKAASAGRCGGTTCCPFGLLMSEHTLATSLDGATPTEHVSPPVASRTASRIRAAATSAVTRSSAR